MGWLCLRGECAMIFVLGVLRWRNIKGRGSGVLKRGRVAGKMDWAILVRPFCVAGGKNCCFLRSRSGQLWHWVYNTMCGVVIDVDGLCEGSRWVRDRESRGDPNPNTMSICCSLEDLDIIIACNPADDNHECWTYGLGANWERW